jgi:hypothetical protein
MVSNLTSEIATVCLLIYTSMSQCVCMFDDFIKIEREGLIRMEPLAVLNHCDRHTNIVYALSGNFDREIAEKQHRYTSRFRH